MRRRGDPRIGTAGAGLEAAGAHVGGVGGHAAAADAAEHRGHPGGGALHRGGRGLRGRGGAGTRCWGLSDGFVWRFLFVLHARFLPDTTGGFLFGKPFLMTG